MDSAFKIHVFRLTPHQDLRRSILAFARAHAVRAGIMLTCVGSLEQVHLRYANQKSAEKKAGAFEIVSCTGTFSDDGTGHFHISIADGGGNVFGGHLLDENKIFTTAEIAVASLTDLAFLRETDAVYGLKELVVKKISASRSS